MSRVPMILGLVVIALIYGCAGVYPRKDLAPDQVQAIDRALTKLPIDRK